MPRRIDPSALAGYDRDQVAEHLRGAADDLLYVVDEIVEADLDSLGLVRVEPGVTRAARLPPGEVFKPPLLALALTREARASRVALTSSGLAQSYEGDLQQIDWNAVGVMRDEDGDLVVFGQDGQAIPLGPTLYKHGQRLVDAVLANVPASLLFDAPRCSVDAEA